MSHDDRKPYPKPKVNKSRRTYRVELKRSAPGTFSPTGERFNEEDSLYLPADGSGSTMGPTVLCHVVTDDPTLIYKKFGADVVISITDIGSGYALPEDVP